MNRQLTVEDDFQDFEDQIKDTKWDYGNISTCFLIDPKSDSSVSKVVQQLSWWTEALQTKEAILNAILRKIWWYGVRIDTHLLEMKEEATYGTKDDPVPSHIQGVPHLNPKT
jgi:hypothetical protein